MAYLAPQTVKEIRQEIKKTFLAKDGFKMSVTLRHYSTICVTVKQSPLAFSSGRVNINDHYVSNIENANERLVFEIIEKIIRRHTGGQVDRNAGDMGADYCDCNFYKDFEIGTWENDCIFLN